MKKQMLRALLVLTLGMCMFTGCKTNKKQETKQEVQVEKKEEPQNVEYDITLGFAGDINFADDYLPVQHYNAIGGSKITDCISEDYVKAMQDMSLMWINNEFTYSNQGAPMAGKAYTFRSKPEHVQWLKDMGVDVVGLANNHVYDYGAQAFDDTLTTLEDAGIPYGGAGRNLEEAMQPVYVDVDGFTIAYVAASRAEKYRMTPQATETEGGILRCYDNTLFLQAIAEAKKHADYVIALPHWGTEGSTVLEDAQITGAREYIEAGADAVVGAHPHILQGMEYVNGKPVVYSLGNFWFDDRDESTMIAVLHLKGIYPKKQEPNLDNATISLEILPGTQRNYETFLQTEESERRRIFDELEDISVNVTIDDAGVVHEASEE